MNSAIIKSGSLLVVAFVFSCACQTENLALAQVERVADEPLEKADVDSSSPVVEANQGENTWPELIDLPFWGRAPKGFVIEVNRGFVREVNLRQLIAQAHVAADTRVADEPLEKEDVESSAPVVKSEKEVELSQPADFAPAEDDNRVAREPLEKADVDSRPPVVEAKPEETATVELTDVPVEGRVPREPLERGGEEAAAPAAAGDGGPEKILDLLDSFNVGGLMDAIQGVPPELKQFMPTLERLLTIEIHFLRKVCNPGPNELKQIRQAGKFELISIAKWLNKNQNRNLGTNDEETPRWRLQNALWNRAEKVLTQEQAARYQQEIQTRNELQKSAAADMMTLHIDRKLSLSPEQYEQLPALLLKNWKPRWSRNLQVYMYDDYCPLPSASVLNPILDDEQKKIWRSKGRDSSIWFGWESDIGLNQFGGGQQLKELDDYSQVEETK